MDVLNIAERHQMLKISLKRFSGGHFLLFCFLLGMAGASVVVRWRGLEILSYKNESTGAASFAEAFFIAAKQRFFQLGAGWLCSLTVYSLWLFGLLTCFWSFSLGMGIVCYTAEKGLFGLPLFLRSLFPQGLFYLCVWYVLSRWSLSRQKRLRLPALGFLMLITACGAAFEAYFS